MSQQFNVVKCFQCAMFQVDIDKKSTNKWTCKLCGSKQSLKQVYFQGESKDCREHVKTLNGNKMLINEMKDREILTERQRIDQNRSNNVATTTRETATITRVSRWAKYIQNDDDDEDNDED